MKNHIVKVKEEGETVWVYQKIELTKEEYPTFRQNFLTDHTKRLDGIRNMKEKLVEIGADTKEDDIDADFLESVQHVITALDARGTADNLRDNIKDEEKIAEISEENVKKLKPLG